MIYQVIYGRKSPQQTFCLNAQKNHNFKPVNVKGPQVL
jgi:hypothetical protein